MPSKVNNNHLSTHRSVILHYYNFGHSCAAEIARQTKIPVRTVRYNIAKIRKEGTVEHRGGNGRPRKTTADDNIAIGQWIRRNNEITAKEIVEKLWSTRDLNVSRWTVRRQLHRLGYVSVLPQETPMLTKEHKEKRVQ
jgi:transposase